MLSSSLEIHIESVAVRSKGLSWSEERVDGKVL